MDRQRKAKLTTDSGSRARRGRIILCKCEFGQGQLLILGYKVGLGQVLSTDANIRAIKEMTVPNDWLLVG